MSRSHLTIASAVLAHLTPEQLDHLRERGAWVAVVDPATAPEAALRLRVIASEPFAFAPDHEEGFMFADLIEGAGLDGWGDGERVPVIVFADGERSVLALDTTTGALTAA